MKKLLFLSSGIGLLLLAFIFIKPPTCGADCPPKSTVVSLDAPAFSRQLEGDMTLIDLRTPEEYSVGHIDRSLNINFNNQVEFSQFLSSSDKNKHYLIYCRTGNRSGQAMELMQTKGFTRITNLSGGIVSWQAAGLPIK